MNTRLTRMDVSKASEELKHRTLASFPTDIGKLIYLASTRDYNTGKYYHDGFAQRFSEETASTALAACHKEIFKGLVNKPLQELVNDLREYLESIPSETDQVLEMWQELEPYRVTIPLGANRIAAHLFASNLKIALAIVECRRKARRSGSLDASQPR
jgi:hypothetical protein